MAYVALKFKARRFGLKPFMTSLLFQLRSTTSNSEPFINNPPRRLVNNLGFDAKIACLKSLLCTYPITLYG